MKVTHTAIPGVLIIEPKVFRDASGFFYQSFSCRIPDHCIDSKRYPLFMAREVMRQLIDNLCVTTAVQPGALS
jgi:hypothetical protein